MTRAAQKMSDGVLGKLDAYC